MDLLGVVSAWLFYADEPSWDGVFVSTSTDDGISTALTVITPCFNAIGTIRDTLLSMSQLADELRRRDLTLEYLIIDGGSRDGTLQLICNYKKVHTFCRIITNITGGPYVAMNVGISVATGQFTHILNADDFIVDPYLYASTLQEAMASNAEFILGSIVYFKRPHYTISSYWLVWPLPARHEYWKQRLRGGLHYPHPGFIARTSQYQGREFDCNYSLSADYKMMQQLLLVSKSSDVICVCHKPIVAMAQGGMTSGWRAIVSGYLQIKAINRELSISAPAWRRYISKCFSRYILKAFPWLRPIGHQGIGKRLNSAFQDDLLL